MIQENGLKNHCEKLELSLSELAKTLEHYFFCPYCGESISMIIESDIAQRYVEDCEVCCCPIVVDYVFKDETLVSFSAMADG